MCSLPGGGVLTGPGSLSLSTTTRRREAAMFDVINVVLSHVFVFVHVL